MTMQDEQKVRDRIIDLEKEKADLDGESISHVQGQIDALNWVLMTL